MNGFVANLSLPPVRRLVRATLVFACCVLSVSLIGAMHTRTPDAAQAAKVSSTVSALPVSKAPLADEVATDVVSDGASDIASEPEDVDDDQEELLHEVRLAAFQVQPTRRTLEAAAVAPTVSPSIAPVVPPTPAAESFRVVWMEVTAYCPCKKCCGPRAQGLTASGRHVSYNGGRFVAADKALPFNTRLLIPGYAGGEDVPVLDRGGAIKGNKLDVYFPTHEQAKLWGRRFIPVTVLN